MNWFERTSWAICLAYERCCRLQVMMLALVGSGKSGVKNEHDECGMWEQVKMNLL